VTTATTRISGRPRSTEADRAILRAAVELCAEEGFDGMTVEAVAVRAGVGKATVYRRYPNRVALIVASAHEVCSDLAPEPDTGSVREDLRMIANGIARALGDPRTRAMLAELSAAAARSPELRVAQQSFVASRRAIAAEAIRRGIARKELRADTDIDLLTDLVASPLLHRAVSLGLPVDRAYVEALVGAAVQAYAAHPGEGHAAPAVIAALGEQG
jgi:AcrR family transcriptional regulator